MESKTFRFVQVWPKQLLRTQRYEAALTERTEAIDRDIMKSREDEIFVQVMRNIEIGQRSSRRRSGIILRKNSIANILTRKRSVVEEPNLRRISRPTLSRLPSISDMSQMMSLPEADESANDAVHYVLPPLLLPPVYLGKSVDFKKLQHNRRPIL